MIRTNIVKLSVIDAVAYRQRLKKGGAGIVVIREGAKQPGIASISKTSGEAIPADNTPKSSIRRKRSTKRSPSPPECPSRDRAACS